MSQFQDVFVTFKPTNILFLNRLGRVKLFRDQITTFCVFFSVLCLTQAYAHFVSCSYSPSRTSVPPQAHSLQRDVTKERARERYCSAPRTFRKSKTGISNMLSHCISTSPPWGAVDGSCFAVYTSLAVSGGMHVLFLERTAMIIIPKQNIMQVHCQMVFRDQIWL